MQPAEAQNVLELAINQYRALKDLKEAVDVVVNSQQVMGEVQAQINALRKQRDAATADFEQWKKDVAQQMTVAIAERDDVIKMAKLAQADYDKVLTAKMALENEFQKRRSDLAEEVRKVQEETIAKKLSIAKELGSAKDAMEKDYADRKAAILSEIKALSEQKAKIESDIQGLLKRLGG